jgi:mRNA-degrading endonuclease toxin of MazEF toxin-antitoxin module
VVVQMDALNELDGYANVIVVPLTTKERRSKTYVPVTPSVDNRLTAPSWAIANQIFTIDKGELKDSLGRITRQEMYELKQALAFVLDIA